ncbi:MAG: Rieske (2Fe-2S) protein [Candidatus Binataceae bacterium]
MSAGSVAQIGLGQGCCFLIGTRKIALFRLRNGKLFALDAICPHRGGPLAEGVVGCETVICPLHGYKFSLTDGRGLDSDFSVRTYATEIRNGYVYVRLPL